ncbi:hypothetical protein [Pseudoalteromonas denitrificans]|nr:hypothetical protein [Pseudoalteromonas denitrificans]
MSKLEKLLIKKYKSSTMVIVGVLLAGVLMFIDYLLPVYFSAEGVISKIYWKTSNHQMPMFVIKNKDSIVNFQDNRVRLKPGQIKVGDSFKKISGSKMCIINGVEMLCIK